MRTVVIERDKKDKNMALIYAVFARHHEQALSGSMHIDDIDAVFGANIASKVIAEGQVEIEVTANILDGQ